MSKLAKAPTEQQVIDLFMRSGSEDRRESAIAMEELAVAIQEPLRTALLHGANLQPIFTPVVLAPAASPEFQIDILTPGEEDQYIAYTNPGNGRIPERHIEGDYVMVPTYGIANAIDWKLEHARTSRFDIMQRALQIFEAGFVRKMNNDGWHTVLSAATDRNILVHDADANDGQFTKRLITLAQVLMQRNAGGNGTSLNPGRLTDVFMSLEGLQDVRNWGVDQVDDFTRREIYLAPNGDTIRIYGVTIHSMFEFGVGQEYQLYYTNQLGASMPSGDQEIAIGVDLTTDDSFMMPVKQQVNVYDDPTLHRRQRAGVYGWANQGFAVLDNRRLLVLSF